MRWRTALLAALLCLGLDTALVPRAYSTGEPLAGGAYSTDGPLDRWSSRAMRSEPVSRPLVGRVVVLDAGHQLGNHNYPRQINRPVPAGGFSKPCNTTGTSTNGGYPEATFTWQVTRLVRTRLRALGARVVMVRTSNREDRWGPCIDVRGRAGNAVDADLKISIHADGSYAAGARGFHVITPAARPGWTAGLAPESVSLSRDMKRGLKRAGLPVANYIAGGDGLDVRSDIGTLNLSGMPVAMVELGNMRNAREARRMTSNRGRATYAEGLVRGVRSYLS